MNSQTLHRLSLLSLRTETHTTSLSAEVRGVHKRSGTCVSRCSPNPLEQSTQQRADGIIVAVVPRGREDEPVRIRCDRALHPSRLAIVAKTSEVRDKVGEGGARILAYEKARDLVRDARLAAPLKVPRQVLVEVCGHPMVHEQHRHAPTKQRVDKRLAPR